MSAMNAPEPERPEEKHNVRLLRRRRERPRMTLRQRMPAEKLRKGVYLIPSLFTAGNLMCGFFSIIATFRGEYVNAALLILLANVFDGVDGYVARLTRTTSQFGVEFDSLADVVAFGVAPAVLVYIWALDALAELGLAGGGYLCGVWCGAAIAFQCPGPRTGEESFRRSADSRRGADDYRVGDIVLLYGFRGGADAPLDVSSGDLRFGDSDG